MYHLHGAGADWAWWLPMIALWALIVVGVLWLLRDRLAPHLRRDATGAQAPGAILKRRLAAGELSIDEYERLLEVLERPAPRRPEAESPSHPERT